MKMNGCKISPLATAMAACLLLSSTWGKSFSIDLRQPDADVGVRAAANSTKTLAGQADSGLLRRVDLDAGRADVGAVAVGDELSLSLFDDVKVTLTLKKQMPSPLGGDVFLAEASGYDNVKNAVVLKTEEGLTIDIQDYRNKKVYKVLSTASGVTVQELVAGGASCGCDTLELPKPTMAASAKEAGRGVVPNGTVTVDMLVAYDGNASNWAAANGGITNFAILAVQKMNTVLANNGLDSYFRFRLVGVTCVSASSSNLQVALENSANGASGWEAISAKRDEVGADIVTVLIDTGSAYGTTGLGFSLHKEESYSDFSWFEGMAYNACLIRSVALSHSMTHEVGHNMGCGHSDVQSTSPGPQLYDYSSGYYFSAGGDNYHTVMAYGTEGPGGEEAPYFSSPDHSYKGVAVGDANHDNRWTIYNTYNDASRWRAAKSGEITTGESDLPPSDPLTWLTSRAAAISKAKAEGKKVFLIYGRDTCWNTQTTKNSSCEAVAVKSILYKDYVCWYSNCDIDEQSAESRGYFDSSIGSTLPFIAVIDPTSNTALATEGGYHDSDDLLVMLSNVGTPLTYTLRLHRNYSSGDTSSAGRSMTYGKARALPKIESELKWAPRSGYSFLGWGAGASATTATYTDGQSVKNLSSTQGATVHLYAIWRKSTPSPFTFSGGDWTQESDGSWRSAAIGDNGRTSASMTVTGPGSISFLYKTSSEYQYDELHFYVDGKEIGGPFSGATDWGSLAYDVATSGPVTLKWEYAKDESFGEGDDCAWIKNVTWTPKAQPAKTYIVRLHRNNSERDGSTAGRTYTIGKARALPKVQNELKWAPRKGYDFLGWAKTADATTAQYTDGQSLKDLTKTAGATVHLYAVWKAHKYVVRLHRNNSKNDGATTGRAFDYDQVRFLPTMAEIKWVRSGYMFLGWSLAQNSSTVKYADGLNVFNLSANDGEELHVWGVWKKAEANAYLLRLHRNNSERDGATAGRQLKLNTSRKLPTVKELGWSRTDATFKGWATTAKNAAAGKVAYKDGATVTNLVKTQGDTAHIYAVWQ